jgi:hypothetical protein
MPEQEGEGLARFENDDLIYDDVFLQRSYFVLRDKTSLALPGESDALIEAVYSKSSLPGLSPSQQQKLQQLFAKMTKKAADSGLDAYNRLIADVDYAEVLGAEQVDYAEDDPTVHRDLQALTRDTRPSVQLVCLEHTTDGSLFLLDGRTPFDLAIKPSGEVLKKALRSIVTVSDYRVVEYFQHLPPHKAWKKSPQLRFAYPVIFDEAGKCPLGGELALNLDEESGLKVQKVCRDD